MYRAADGKTWTGKGRPPAWIPPAGPEREALRIA
jgi:DNA-binding protein H-NS